MAESQGTLDIEFVTDRDTEAALLDWCARRRRALVPGSVFLLTAELLVLVDIGMLWRHERRSVAFLAAMALQIVAFTVAAIARDPDRPKPLAYPHGELVSLAFLAASFVITFEHQSSVWSLVLMAAALALIVILIVTCWRGVAVVRDRIADYGRAVHVHVDDDGIELTVRPQPRPRRIPWKSMRYVGSDAQFLFVVAGVQPFVVPRRAFPSSTAWDGFVATIGERRVQALTSSRRTPIGGNVRRPKARRA